MRKAATSKQPARLTAHHTLPLEGHTKDPTQYLPFPDQNTLTACRAAAASAGGGWCGRCGWVVAGQQVGLVVCSGALQGVGGLAAMREQASASVG